MFFQHCNLWKFLPWLCHITFYLLYCFVFSITWMTVLPLSINPFEIKCKIVAQCYQQVGVPLYLIKRKKSLLTHLYVILVIKLQKIYIYKIYKNLYKIYLFVNLLQLNITQSLLPLSSKKVSPSCSIPKTNWFCNAST